MCESGLSEAATCTYQEPSTGLVYDLNPLRITTANLDHKIVDLSSRHDDSLNASYIFNVCSNVVTPRVCTNTSGGGGDLHNGPAPAYQLFTGDAVSSCSRLGSSVSNGSSVRMGLVEKTKPARGVYLAYSVSQGARTNPPPLLAPWHRRSSAAHHATPPTHCPVRRHVRWRLFCSAVVCRARFVWESDRRRRVVLHQINEI